MKLIISAAKAYFERALHENFSWMVSQIPAWTAAQGEAHGWIPGDYGVVGALPPWQQDYFASVVIGAAKRGDADALTLLNWQTNFLVGRFTHAAEGFLPHDGAAYLIATGDAAGNLYQTWEEIGAQTEARGWSNGAKGWSQSQGDYPQLALATLAAIWRLTGSQAAADAYDHLIANGAPFTATKDYARDPTFAIAAPGRLPPAAPQPNGDMQALTVSLSGQAWEGNPIAIILVDGQERFRGEITAAHGRATELHALGDISRATAHDITIRFSNDAWGGNAGADRNLYIDSLSAGGVAFGSSGELLSNGDFNVHLPAVVPVPEPQPLPQPGTLLAAPNLQRIALSGDSWQEVSRYLDGPDQADLSSFPVSSDGVFGF